MGRVVEALGPGGCSSSSMTPSRSFDSSSTAKAYCRSSYSAIAVFASASLVPLVTVEATAGIAAPEEEEAVRLLGVGQQAIAVNEPEAVNLEIELDYLNLFGKGFQVYGTCGPG